MVSSLTFNPTQEKMPRNLLKQLDLRDARSSVGSNSLSSMARSSFAARQKRVATSPLEKAMSYRLESWRPDLSGGVALVGACGGQAQTGVMEMGPGVTDGVPEIIGAGLGIEPKSCK